MALLGTGFDPTVPTDNDPVSEGAAQIRDIKQRLQDFVSVSFDPDTGELLEEAIPNPVTTPYGAAGTVYTSSGPSSAPVWGSATGVPAGVIVAWGASALPAGYLECVGGTVLIASYAALAAVLGTTWGGDGVNTFGLPDLRGRSPIGVGTGDATDASAWTLTEKGGTETHTLVETEVPAHTHGITMFKNDSTGGGQTNTAYLANDNGAVVNDLETDEFGGDQPHENMHPVTAVKFIIKT